MYRMVKIFLIVLLLASLIPGPVAAQAGLNPVILQPHNGDVLQGSVAITGSSDIAGFASLEIDFAYADDSTGTWFLLASLNQPVQSGTLAQWDTTGITDGNYNLRLRVSLTDGSFRDATVQGLQVRNYTPAELPTSLAPASQPATALQATPTETPFPTPTALPRNPAALTPVDVSASMIAGGLVAVLLILLLGIYLRAKRT